ncbi:methyltransferase domain-containing protein [Desulfopila inferna]|uniref:methyltransferase domain-containing protein n=1 Tax=Desulfopila inferna TaxID=468528 RepID=UPI0019637688|nr:methyltransferase domain-containing protein [Desulfopila inferna]MBM9603961.1 methyltransferase domain-containing protein [Desulfopila inferna]
MRKNPHKLVTDLHNERLDLVVQTLLKSEAESVLDLGCGAGELLVRLMNEKQFRKIVGIDTSKEALAGARSMFSQPDVYVDKRLSIFQASYTSFDEDMAGFDAAVMVETIEHLEPQRLSAVEKVVFSCCRPKTVIITTPNQEYNVLHGVPEGEFRHPGHLFEWSRAKFRNWAEGVAGRKGYHTSFDDIGPFNPVFGSSSQMVTFTRS